jgi:hypothetical protein
VAPLLLAYGGYDKYDESTVCRHSHQRKLSALSLDNAPSGSGPTGVQADNNASRSETSINSNDCQRSFERAAVCQGLRGRPESALFDLALPPITTSKGDTVPPPNRTDPEMARLCVPAERLPKGVLVGWRHPPVEHLGMEIKKSHRVEPPAARRLLRNVSRPLWIAPGTSDRIGRWQTHRRSRIMQMRAIRSLCTPEAAARTRESATTVPRREALSAVQ